MYTQCPDCQEAFRVTAEILQQAGGRVRCGACGHTFDALDGLSEAPPSHPAEPSDEDERSFRAALDELGDAGNVRIEDTGVEWRVVEEDTGTDGEGHEDDPSSPSALRWMIRDDAEEPQNDAVIPEAAGDVLQEPLELDTRTAAEERYDDDTPLPGVLDDDEDEAPAIPEPPRRRSEDFIEPRSVEFDERQVDLALGDPEEWTDLLQEVGEVDDAEPAAAVAGARAPGSAERRRAGKTRSGLEAPDADEDPTAEHPVLDADELTLVEDDAEAAGVHRDRREPAADSEEALELVTEGDAAEALELVADEDAAEALELVADEDEGEEPRAAGEPGERRTPAPAAAPPSAPVAHHAPPRSEEELTVEALIDQELLRLSDEHEDLAATSSRTRGPAVPPPVETIVMEGEFVRSSLHGEVAVPEAAAAPLEDAQAPLEDAGTSLKDTYIRSRNKARGDAPARDPRRYAGIAAAVLLGLLLAAQLVHAYRETLATYDLFNGTVGVVYRRLGAPITPDWDVNGWQFETTSGSTDASGSTLTITSRIANRSPRTLPYPLLHVTLTDRYEEVVGSELLEPAQYLAIRSARGMVDPGEKFNATVSIAPLSNDATGFKLNVCYPVASERVRCATGAFKRE